jgi:hypothetical protein
MDLATSRDPNATFTSDPALQSQPESSPDHASTNSSESASCSVPAPPERGAHSPTIATRWTLEDSHAMGNTEAAGYIVPRRSITREAVEE